VNNINRRSALAAIPATALGALLAGPSRSAEESTDKRETFAVGPFALGDWYKKYRLQNKEKGPLINGAPDDDQIRESLNACQLYVIDGRVWTDRNKPRFEETRPKVAAEGKLIYSWNKDELTCLIWPKEMSAKDVRTDCDANPPWRRLDIQISIEILGADRNISLTKVSNFVSDPVIAYDVNGNARRI